MQNRNTLFGYRIHNPERFGIYSFVTAAMSGLVFAASCTPDDDVSKVAFKGLVSLGIFVTLELMALNGEERFAREEENRYLRR